MTTTPEDFDAERDNLNYRLEMLEEAAITLHDAKIAFTEDESEHNDKWLDTARRDFNTALGRFQNCKALA